MKNFIVFNDSHQSDGFEFGVEKINILLKKHKLKIELVFIEDFVSDEGEYAFKINLIHKG